MKRLYKTLALLCMLIAMCAALALTAGATELKTGIGNVTASSLRLRAKNNTDAEILTNAKYGDQVVIIRQVGDWYLVDYNLYIGYMSAEYVTVKDRENIELGKGSINPSVANIRSEPSTGGSVVAKATGGSLVQIIGFNCGWYKVTYDGTTGYIRSDLVTLTEKPYSNSGSACGSAGVSAAPATSSSSSSASSSSEAAAVSEAPASTTSAGQNIVATAKKYLGYRYVWGGASPSGFDCSGFTYYIFKQYGITLNRTADGQLSNGTAVSKSDLLPGDLVLFGNTYASSKTATHVGIYIGGGQFIHSANSSTGVVISSLDSSYYASRYVGARRIVW